MPLENKVTFCQAFEQIEGSKITNQCQENMWDTGMYLKACL